jgi:EAL domain-containing protein (putative c-di-GMP-specific phosphodiesterase class I)
MHQNVLRWNRNFTKLCIVPIGEWALRTACNQAKLWEQAGYDPLRVAVNLSARQFQQENLVQMIQQVLQETDMQPELLELEITESAVMKNPDAVIGVLHELKRLGMKLSIDDFGTGYSSLSYLRDFPIDRLKIDRSFVSAITEKDDAVIAQSIIAMAHNLHLSVLAEGVENELQFAFLREQKCDEMQGYLYSKPLSAEEIKQWLQKRAFPNAVHALRENAR